MHLSLPYGHLANIVIIHHDDDDDDDDDQVKDDLLLQLATDACAGLAALHRCFHL